MVELVHKIAKNINIPFTVGGGVSSLEDVSRLLNAGADRIAINSAAVYNPDLINKLAKKFGRQCIVVAIDAKLQEQDWKVYVTGGKKATNIDLFTWAKEVQERGAGEILFTSMNHDGTKSGFANQALNKLHSLLNIPIIASGGAGKPKDILEAFTEGNADAALAASVFHFKEIELPALKQYLKTNGINIRI